MKTEIVICDLCGQMTEEGDKVGGDTPFILGVIADDKDRQLTQHAGQANSHICRDCIQAIVAAYKGAVT